MGSLLRTLAVVFAVLHGVAAATPCPPAGLTATPRAGATAHGPSPAPRTAEPAHAHGHAEAGGHAAHGHAHPARVTPETTSDEASPPGLRAPCRCGCDARPDAPGARTALQAGIPVRAPAWQPASTSTPRDVLPARAPARASEPPERVPILA